MSNTQKQDILTFLQRANKLKSVPRYGASLVRNGDTVAEHSWRLALMVYVVGARLEIDIDLGKALAMALLHDLAESKTGDIDAYRVIMGGASIQEKEKEEQKAMHEITAGLRLGDSIYSLWDEFEKQQCIEAKFVKALDKIEAYLHIADRGVETYLPKEFHAHYASEAVKAFDDATQDCYELREFLELVKNDLREKFSKVGVKWLDNE